MKTLCCFVVLCLFAGSVSASAAPPESAKPESGKPVAVKPESVAERVHLALFEVISVTFKRDGDGLTKPVKGLPCDDVVAGARVRLQETTDSPIPPPREGATRPFLAIENLFDKPLHFRVLVRLKGSTEFFALKDGITPVDARSTFHKCWGFDTAIEEVVLYDFRLGDIVAENAAPR